MPDAPPTGTLATSAVGLAGWGMIALGAWTITACEIHANTYESCAPSRSEGAAWIMGGVGTKTGLATFNPALREPKRRDQDDAPGPDPNPRNPP